MSDSEFTKEELQTWANASMPSKTSDGKCKLEYAYERFCNLPEQHEGKCDEVFLAEHQRTLFACQALRLMERVEVLSAALREIDLTLRIPAAEYVPAIGDVFSIIDRVGCKADAKTPAALRGEQVKR